MTYNGGRSGIWTTHVAALRAANPAPAQLIAAARIWVDSCSEVFDPSRKEAKDQRPYALAPTKRNLDLWAALPPDQLASRFDEDAQDLFAFGLLRAQRSYGRNGERGFPGIWQVDVFYRRSIEAVGWGHLRGDTSRLTSLYASPR